MDNTVKELLQQIAEPTTADWLSSAGSITAAIAGSIAAWFAWRAYKKQNERLDKQQKDLDRLQKWENRRYQKDLLQDRKTASSVKIQPQLVTLMGRNGLSPNGKIYNSKSTIQLSVTVSNNSDSPLYDLQFKSSQEIFQFPFRAFTETPSMKQPFTLNEGATVMEITGTDGAVIQKIETVFNDNSINIFPENTANYRFIVLPKNKIEFVVSFDATDLEPKGLTRRIEESSSVLFTDNQNLRWEKKFNGDIKDVTEYPDSPQN